MRTRRKRTYGDAMAIHSFRLQTLSDLLAKVKRELERFRKSTNPDSAEYKFQSDHAFNFVLSAWHMTEWLWISDSHSIKAVRECESFKNFHAKVRRECEALQICYELYRDNSDC